MKNFIALVLICTFSWGAYSAEIENPLLWKAEKNGNVAYIFGTFHLGFGLSDLPSDFKSYVDTSEYFYVETDLSSVDQNEVLKRAIYPEGQSLDLFLPEDTWKDLVTQFSFVPEEQLKTFKPWFVVSNLVTQVAVSQLELEGSLDIELLSYAKEQNKFLGYLEDTTLQFSVLEATFSLSVLYETMAETDNLVEDSKSQLLSIYNCYQVSDVLCLERMLGLKENGGTMHAWQYDLLLKQRNITWIPTIERSVLKGTTFVAVGAGHLVGESNVLDLLRGRGFSIEQVY